MPTPESLCRSGTEDGHQTALFAWANMVRLYGYQAALDDLCYTKKGYAAEHYDPIHGIQALEMLFAVPNGGLRDKITAAKLRATGVRAGYPDIALDAPRGPFHGLRIELKRPESEDKRQGRTTQRQNSWLERLRQYGYRAEVCVGWQEAARLIFHYLNS